MLLSVTSFRSFYRLFQWFPPPLFYRIMFKTLRYRTFHQNTMQNGNLFKSIKTIRFTFSMSINVYLGFSSHGTKSNIYRNLNCRICTWELIWFVFISKKMLFERKIIGNDHDYDTDRKLRQVDFTFRSFQCNRENSDKYRRIHLHCTKGYTSNLRSAF